MTTDLLTENGILSDHPDVTMIDYSNLHGEPVVETDEVVIYRDERGYELNEWSNVLEMDRGELSERMHDLAREHYDPDGTGDPWSTADPIVFNAETFTDGDGYKTMRVPTAAWWAAREQKEAADRTWGEQIVRPDSHQLSEADREAIAKAVVGELEE